MVLALVVAAVLLQFFQQLMDFAERVVTVACHLLQGVGF